MTMKMMTKRGVDVEKGAPSQGESERVGVSSLEQAEPEPRPSRVRAAPELTAPTGHRPQDQDRHGPLRLGLHRPIVVASV